MCGDLEHYGSKSWSRPQGLTRSSAFRYSHTEISASGGKARVKSRRARFEDGKLTSEAFEGELDCSAYEQIVSEAQHQFLAQTALLMKSLSWLLPFSGKHRPDRD